MESYNINGIFFVINMKSSNGVRFRMSAWKGDPGKSKESRDFAKLFKMFSPDNYSSLPVTSKDEIKYKVICKIYNYINWTFDYKFRSGEKSVTGTGIFVMPSMINEFERMYSSYLVKNANKQSLGLFLKWCNDNVPEIFNMHQIEDLNDLKMLSSYFNASEGLTEDSPENKALLKAKDMGLL